MRYRPHHVRTCPFDTASTNPHERGKRPCDRGKERRGWGGRENGGEQAGLCALGGGFVVVGVVETSFVWRTRSPASLTV